MDAVEEIKDRLSIEDIVGRYVDLKRSGVNFKGLCPFHGEKTPSFYVSPARNSFHCFGCGKGGDIFSFVMEIEHLPFPEALTRLAEQAGVTLPERKVQHASLSGRLYEANTEASHLFRKALESAEGRGAREYLARRSFGADAVESFDLGYAPDGRNTIALALQAAGFDNDILLAAGLVFQDENNPQPRDRFRNRLIFPIRDRAGKIVGFGGRTLGDAQPKYLNSPQTEIFDKSGVLFGIHRAQDAIRQSKRAVLVEGYLDAIRAHIHGYPDTVASLGTAVTPRQLTVLSRLSDTVILALDPDAAGQAAAARTSLNALAEVTRQRGRKTGTVGALELRIARLVDGQGDPDEIIRDSPDVWEQALANSIPAFEFYFMQTLGSIDRSSDSWRQEAIDRLLPVIQQFGESVGWQATWVERLARETGVDPGRLQQSLPHPTAPTRGESRRSSQRTNAHEVAASVVSGTTSREIVTNPRLGVERSLLALLLKLVVIPEDAAEILSPNDVSDTDLAAILHCILAWRSTQNHDYEMLRETIPPHLQAIADELRAVDMPLPEDGKQGIAIALHLGRLRAHGVQSRLARASQFSTDLEPNELTTALASLAQLMQEKRQVEHTLQRLNEMGMQSTGGIHQGTMDHDSGRL